MRFASALTRRQLLGSTAALAFAQERRPNVLVFMTDQESALLPGLAELPNRRRIERDGVRFTLAFSNTPQCSAARSSLLTGLEPHQTGVRTNVDESSLGKPLSPAIPNVGSVFAAAGYRTGYFGKWHLGGVREQFGFGSIGREQPDGEVAREAAAWIAQQKAPWLAWVSVLNPHNIYSIPRVLETIRPRAGVRPPASDLSNLAVKPAEQQAYVDRDQGRQTRGFTPEDWLRYRTYYLELVEKADANLGTVLDAVPDLDSTIVVYTSDHGDALGEHGLPYKGPFMYEEETRIPLTIRAPGRMPPGERTDLVVQADLAPTLAGLCGVRWPGRVTGRNLAAGGAPRDAVFLEYYAKQKWVNPIRTIRGGRWKLNWYDSGHQELYDLRADPHEIHNLAAEAAARDVKADLERRLDAWRGKQ
ncbi:MAG: sulfatase-like hydrolase/transferase [Acidobacteria bacterium]|nr:sulfatase-like hydrolase/transferase [Acidobacteriota bacterium]